jgi:hypothetical protein
LDWSDHSDPIVLRSRRVDAIDLRRFARRDWDLIAQTKEELWLEQKAAMSPSEAIALAAELARYARAVKTDWPNDQERAEDLAAHIRLAELLLNATRHRPR